MCSYISVESFFYHVSVPNGAIELNLNTHSPGEMYVRVPYNISNQGYFDITTISVNISLDLLYIENITYSEKRTTIFLKENFNIEGCHPGQELISTLEGGFPDFNIDALVTYNNEVDVTNKTFILMKVELSAYLYGVISMRFSLENILVGEIS